MRGPVGLSGDCASASPVKIAAVKIFLVISCYLAAVSSWAVSITAYDPSIRATANCDPSGENSSP